MRGANIDLGLAVMLALRDEGEDFQLTVIAEVCECSRENIAQIERRAIKKVRKRFLKAVGPFIALRWNRRAYPADNPRG